jgi:hypothetical protein
MTAWLFGTMIFLIGGTFLVAALMTFVHGMRRLRSWRGWLGVLASVLAVLGVCGFFGAAFSSLGGLDWLGSFEWPIGYTSGIVRMPDGTLVVPHTPSGRIQLYDSALRFIRGWRIEASGGTFTIRAPADGTIDVHTARRALHLVYNRNGKLLSQETYDLRHDASPLNTPPEAFSEHIPTRWVLWPLTGPFYAWCCILLAMLIWHRVDRADDARGEAGPAIVPPAT